MNKYIIALTILFSHFALAKNVEDVQALKAKKQLQSQNSLSLIKKQMVASSLALYKGSCPCPYNVDENGNLCGLSSEYSSQIEVDFFCYESDIADYVVKRNIDVKPWKYK